MAKILKERARSAVIDNAVVAAGIAVGDGIRLFRLDLHASAVPSYSVHLSEAEMLGIVAEWLRIKASETKRSHTGAK